MNIGSVGLGRNHPCRIVAEISNAHNGSLDRCLRLIDAAVEAGADCVKLQCYTPEELVALRGDGPAPAQWSHLSMRELYEKARTPLEWFPIIAKHCAESRIPWFSSVFGLESLKVLEECGCPAFKIAALDRHQWRLLEAVHATGKPMAVSYDTDDQAGYHPDLKLYCPPDYPTPVDNIVLPAFMDITGVRGADMETSWFHGLSSHCLAPELPIAAVARGAKVLEYHVMLADEPSELEANISLDQHALQAMVESVRTTERMLA